MPKSRYRRRTDSGPETLHTMIRNTRTEGIGPVAAFVFGDGPLKRNISEEVMMSNRHGRTEKNAHSFLISNIRRQ